MATENEQKGETTCNPSNSVVTIHVNKDAICGDSGKSKVDNKTISHNDKGELQWGTLDDLNLKRKFKIEVNSDDHLRKGKIKEELTESLYNRKVYIEDKEYGYQIFDEYNMHEHVIYNRIKSKLNGIDYNKSTANGAYMCHEFESFKTNYGNVERILEISPSGEQYKHLIKGCSNIQDNDSKFNEFNTIVEENGTVLYLESGVKDSTKTSILISTSTDGNAKLQVGNKDVVRSINGVLANESGEIVFEEFPSGVVLQSPNQFKYRVTVDDDGSLATTKI